jgi:hypothetical protein
LSSNPTTSHQLRTLEVKRFLVELRYKIENLEKTLAYSNDNAPEYQADLGTLIFLNAMLGEHYEHVLERDDPATRADRRSALAEKIADWDQNFPLFKQKHTEIQTRVNEWAKAHQPASQEVSAPPTSVTLTADDVIEMARLLTPAELAKIAPAPPTVESLEKEEAEPDEEHRKPTRRGRVESPTKKARHKIIRELSRRRPELEGVEFWRVATNLGAEPDATWTGCPTDLGKAYLREPWKTKLNQDKSRAVTEK